MDVTTSIKATYDAIIVGSGISGGWAAKELTEKGLKVLVLERGRDVVHVKDYPTALLNPWEFPLRNVKTPEIQERYKLQMRNYGVDEENCHFFVDEVENPYVQTKNEIFVWPRGYQVGGRSLTWGRQCYRFSDLDFEANAKEGVGVDWPIRYKDIEPWYTYVDKFVGISGSKENLDYLPDSVFQKPMEMNCVEIHAAQEIEKQYPGRRMFIGRIANHTEPLLGRGPCQFRNLCSRGCPFGGYFSSNSATLPAAKATGNLTLRPNSIVLSVLYDDSTGKATGVTVMDAESGDVLEFKSKILFLNAGALNTTMILLNSKSSRFPNGLGNDSGELGHNLMTHFKITVNAKFEGFSDKYTYGRRANGIYIPRFRNVNSRFPDFLRGYNYQGGAGRPRKGAGSYEGLGAGLKTHLTQLADYWNMGLSGFGEQLPYHDNFIRLSDTVKDKWGLPAPEIAFEWKENEMKMAKDAAEQGVEMLEKAGFKDVKSALAEMPKSTAHEMGTARMGKDPRTSVLNKNNQVHGVPNVFVTDGACMTSNSCVNPSLTYMALTARACDYAVKMFFNA